MEFIPALKKEIDQYIKQTGIAVKLRIADESLVEGLAADVKTQQAKQIAVLDLIAQGKTYKEVGAALDLTERTVKYHMERIMELLQLENRAQVITYAARDKGGSAENRLSKRR